MIKIILKFQMINDKESLNRKGGGAGNILKYI